MDELKRDWLLHFSLWSDRNLETDGVMRLKNVVFVHSTHPIMLFVKEIKDVPCVKRVDITKDYYCKVDADVFERCCNILANKVKNTTGLRYEVPSSTGWDSKLQLKGLVIRSFLSRKMIPSSQT